ncbi:hypothetical protein BSEG_04487 [Phocaeicola dorei 5_1_36/D4]|nr:hypothetical protein BSEG_04487 [Phocaeicola dorei 5_1_36/D4]
MDFTYSRVKSINNHLNSYHYEKLSYYASCGTEPIEI